MRAQRKLFEPNEEPQELALVAGGEAMEVAVLGNAFEETVLSGDPTEAIEPDEAEPEEIVPEPTEVAEVPPVQSEVTAETPSDIVPTEADVILPAEEIVEAVTAQPEITANRCAGRDRGSAGKAGHQAGAREESRAEERAGKGKAEEEGCQEKGWRCR